MTCASFFTIMLRQIAGRLVSVSDTATSYPAFRDGGVGLDDSRPLRQSHDPQGNFDVAKVGRWQIEEFAHLLAQVRFLEIQEQQLVPVLEITQ